MISEKDLLSIVIKHCYKEYEKCKKEVRDCEKDYQAYKEPIFLNNAEFWKGKQEVSANVLSLLANHGYDVWKVIKEVQR